MRIRKPSAKKDMPLSDNICELCLRALIEDTDGPAFFLDTAYRHISYNSLHATLTEHLYGVKISPGMSFLDCITVKKDRDNAKDDLDRVIKSGEKLIIETVSGDEQRGRRYLNVTHMPIKDEMGEVIGIAVTVQDITERKISSELITASETRYRELFDHIGSCVAVYEAIDNGNDFIIRDFNGAACSIERLNRDEVVGRSVRQVFPGVENFGLFQVFQRVWQTGMPEEFPVAQYQDDRISGWRENYIYKLPSGELVAVYSDQTERKQTLEKLELANDRLELALKGADLGLYDGNIMTGDMYINDQYLNMLGYLPGEIDFNLDLYLKTVHPDDLTGLLATLDDYFRRRDPGVLTLEYRMQHKSGNWIWVMDRFRVVQWDSEGKPLRVAGTHHEITQEKLADEALKASEQAYRDIFESAPVGILHTTADGKLLNANLALARMLGYYSVYEFSEAVNSLRSGETFFANPAQRAEILASIKSQTGWKQFDVEYKRKDGNIITCSQLMRTVKQKDGSIDRLEIFIEDVTERKQALQALERQREEYRTIFDSVPAAVAYIDSKGTFIRVNRPAAEALGYTPAQMVGKNLTDVFLPDDAAAFRSMHHEVLTSGLPLTGSINSYTTRTGQIKWAQNDVVPYLNSKGEIIGAIFFSEDVTDRIKAEHGLKLSYEALNRALEGSVDAIVKVVEMRDPYTAGHQARVTELAVAIAGEMGLAEERIAYIQTAARLHDVGKIYVPSDILSKPGKLSNIEFEIIKTHAQGSYDILKSIDFPGPVAQIALQHHERLNGSGYPHGLSGQDIILEARILAVADVAEAMMSYRPYRPSLGLERALDEIKQGRDDLYDAGAVDACTTLFEEKKFTFAVERSY